MWRTGAGGSVSPVRQSAGDAERLARVPALAAWCRRWRVASGTRAVGAHRAHAGRQKGVASPGGAHKITHHPGFLFNLLLHPPPFKKRQPIFTPTMRTFTLVLVVMLVLAVAASAAGE